MSANRNPILLGMSAPLQGPSEDLGIQMRRGIDAYFKRVNTEGGVDGRMLELKSLNDSYDPQTALTNMKTLLDIREEVGDPDKPDVRGDKCVLAVVGNVGTPPMLVTAPLADKNEVVFFAPFTGAQKYLRDGTNSPYIYNYRAGYYEETEAMVDFLSTFRTPRIITGGDDYKHILAFTQNDSYGDAGYSGLVLAYNKKIAPIPQPDSTAPNPSIARVRYERENVASVDPAIEQAKAFFEGVLAEGGDAKKSVAVLMVDTYLPGNKFIRAAKDWINGSVDRASHLDVLFIHVSFVGSNALASALTLSPESYVDVTDPTGATKKSYAEGVMVTQVVPNYSAQSPGVTDYRTDIGASDGGEHTFTSLEGYIAARLLVEALKINGPDLTDQSLVRTLDTQITNLDIGIGTLLSFSSTNHQASHTVWGSLIGADGSFTMPFVWNPETGIVPGQQSE